MADRLVYVSRLIGLPLLGPDGVEIGRLADVVLGTPALGEAPRVNGFVVAVQRRRLFVSAGRIGDLGSEGARLRYGSIGIHQFSPHLGEVLVASEVVGRRARGKRVVDVGIRPVPGVSYAWELTTLALGSMGLLGHRSPEIVGWDELADLFVADQPTARQAAAIGLLHPVEMAEAIRKLPLERRRVLAGALGDERLADLLEELPESEQVRIVEGLDLEHAARVLDEMDADDAADLLGELPKGRRDALLGAMAPDEAAPVRRLLTYAANTAGGLMTPEPVIMPPTATIAEALARVRDPDLPVSLAAQVFVTGAPHETPTGRYIGIVGIQRLLREVPSKTLGRCLDEQPEAVSVNISEQEVAGRLADYDAVAVPVTDAEGRLVGAVTVDDVMRRLLPQNAANGWGHGAG
ncbi:MAG TPA: CBS domain-containing protein [Chloroflexota bacterium]|jgi:CBS domain-containing protein/sporulation protein YlmC with PRC-barrel domain|nr:CBS domain-containing protein [Chloroflexota bacterium]